MIIHDKVLITLATLFSLVYITNLEGITLVVVMFISNAPWLMLHLLWKDNIKNHWISCRLVIRDESGIESTLTQCRGSSFSYSVGDIVQMSGGVGGSYQLAVTEITYGLIGYDIVVYFEEYKGLKD